MYFTVLERALRPFFLSFTSRTARSRRQSYQMALGSGQDLGSPSAGGGRAVPLSGFCPMPSGRRCPACHPRDCANRPGKTAAGASRGRGEPYTRPRSRSRSLGSPLPPCSAKMAAAVRLSALPLPPKLAACIGSCRCRRRGECVRAWLGINAASSRFGWEAPLCKK